MSCLSIYLTIFLYFYLSFVLPSCTAARDPREVQRGPHLQVRRGHQAQDPFHRQTTAQDHMVGGQNLQICKLCADVQIGEQIHIISTKTITKRAKKNSAPVVLLSSIFADYFCLNVLTYVRHPVHYSSS